MNDNETHEDAKRYTQYLIDNGKKMPDGSEPVLIDFENIDHPVDAIINSIANTLKKVRSENYQVLVDSNTIDEYKKNIYTLLLMAGFSCVIDGSYSDPAINSDAASINEPEEMLGFIFVKGVEDNKVFENFTSGMFTAYYEFCEEKDLPSDKRFINLINKI